MFNTNGQLWEAIVNISTPSTGEEVEKLAAFIDAHPHQVGVNGLYNTVVDAHRRFKEYAYRPGFDFLLWFERKELAEEFAKEFHGRFDLVGSSS